MKKLDIYLFSFILILGLQAQAVEHVYNFNTLETGNLKGVDNWTILANNVGTEFNLAMTYTMLGTLTHDATLALLYGHGGLNVGKTVSRFTQDNFPFVFSAGGMVETEMEVLNGWWDSYSPATTLLDYDSHWNRIVQCEIYRVNGKIWFTRLAGMAKKQMWI